jgi:beta-N-acetylhexosaminidase
VRPLVVGLAGPTLSADERSLLKALDPAGAILFARNIASPAQVRALTDSLRDLTGRADTLILVDQEGGPVARLGPPEWPAFPGQRAFGALYDRAPITAIAAARANAEAAGRVLREAGITANAAPLLDLAHAGGHPAIGTRAFAADAGAAAALGGAVLDGLTAAGILGCIKHLPGQGRAAADSHDTLPAVVAQDAEMEEDLAPFRALAARAPMAMTAHVLFPAWDAERPATLSPRLIADVIRQRIGFAGLLISDDLTMGALAGPMAHRAAGALAAGCDLALIGHPEPRDLDALGAAVPPGAPLPGLAPPPPADLPPLAELLARRDALMAI